MVKGAPAEWNPPKENLKKCKLKFHKGVGVGDYKVNLEKRGLNGRR